MQEIEAASTATGPFETTSEKDEDNLHALMKKRLDEVLGEAFEDRPVSIFRLPTFFHETNKQFCEPKNVAIGPLHRGTPSLKTIEEHKWYILRDFLERQNVGLDKFCKAMVSIEAQARQCYSESVNLGNDDFAMMLVLDGCFILEIFLKVFLNESDKIVNMGWSCIFNDILLSENQVPFFVIHKLWDTRYLDHQLGASQDCNYHCSLIELLSNGLKDFVYNQDQFRKPQIACKDILHLLHLYYAGVVLHAVPQNQTNNNSGVVLDVAPQNRTVKTHRQQLYCSNILCVTELRDAGIQFKRKKEPSHMFDISFENGTVSMPVLYIDNARMHTFWNMVIFEQSCLAFENFPKILSSYLVLMDSLINTEKDVAILERFGILDNFSSNSGEVADFFNQFSNNFYIGDHFDDLYKNVKEYSESTWHTYRARLMEDYFSNPWSIISIVAATILLVLTFVQAYYSAASAKK